MYRNKGGFTLIEIVVVFGFLATLTGVILSSSINFRSSTEVNSVANNVISEIKSQQIKAMVGDTEGSLSNDSFGIYFDSTKYTLFHGNTYNPTDATNFQINLKSGMEFQTTIPNATLIFLQKSGEAAGITSGADTITLNDLTNSLSKTIKINKYGTVTDLY